MCPFGYLPAPAKDAGAVTLRPAFPELFESRSFRLTREIAALPDDDQNPPIPWGELSGKLQIPPVKTMVAK
jgi:hypothetical protein